MDITTNIVKKILENEILRKAIERNDLDTIEMCLVTELKGNYSLRSFIFQNQEREYHKDDVRNEIIYLNEEWNEGEPQKQIIATDEEIEHITDLYEESLGESEDWHDCLKWALEQFRIEKFKQQRGIKNE